MSIPTRTAHMVFDSIKSEYDKPEHFALRYAVRYCTQIAIRHDKSTRDVVSLLYAV